MSAATAWMERQLLEPMKVSTLSRQLAAYPQTSAEGAAFFPEAGELDDRFEVQPWAKVNTMGRQLTALSQARAEGAARFPEADEPGDRFEAQGPGGACGAEDTPTTSARGSSPGTCSSGAPRPAPGLPAPRRWLAAAARDRGAGGPLPRAALRRGPRAPQPTPAETEVLVGNLPGVYSEQMLLEELRDAGFRRGPDFGALRLQAARHGSRLRCLIRFHTVFARNAFVAAFHGRKMRESSQQVHDVVTVAPAAEPARPLGTRASAAPAASQGRAGPRMLGRSVHCVAKHARYCQSCGGPQPTASNFCCLCGTRLPKLILMMLASQ